MFTSAGGVRITSALRDGSGPLVVAEVLRPGAHGGNLRVPFVRIARADRLRVNTPVVTAWEIRLDPPWVAILVEEIEAG